MAIVFAVNCPGQEPRVGRQTRSSWSSSERCMSPAITAPTASNVSSTVTSRPFHLPGVAEPPYMNTEGRLSRTIAIIMPGSVLSQPAKVTSAS